MSNLTALKNNAGLLQFRANDGSNVFARVGVNGGYLATKDGVSYPFDADDAAAKLDAMGCVFVGVSK